VGTRTHQDFKCAIMIPSSRTPEGQPNRCPVCNSVVRMEPSTPPGDAPCPQCGQLLWFPGTTDFDFALDRCWRVERLPCFSRDAIVRDLAATTKRDAIVELVDRLAEKVPIPIDERSGILKAILRREELGSTGIGRGVALPHTKFPSAVLADVVGTVGYSRLGIPFESLDDQPVHMIVLLVFPHDQPDLHLRTLEQVSAQLRE